MLSLDQIIHLLIQYRYFILFPIAIFEGPIISVIAGLLIALKYMDFYVAFPVLVAGDLVGDLLLYALGHWGKKKFAAKWGRYIGINNARLAKIEKHFEKNAGKTLLLGKVFHGIGGVFLFAAGAVNVPFPKFMWFNFLGTVPKSLILISVGFYFGYALATIKSILELVGVFVVGTAAVAILAWLYFHKNENIVVEE